MVKSKFHAKVQAKVGVKASVKKTKSKYYDEHIATSKTSKSNAGFAIFVIVCIIVGASVSGILVSNNNNIINNNDTDDTDPDENNTNTGIKDGDQILFQYNFFIDGNNDGIFSSSELVDNSEAFEWTVAENSEAGFPPAFYTNILGMNLGESKDIIIPATDTNHDGLNDDTGQPVWDVNFAVLNLKYYVLILEIK